MRAPESGQDAHGPLSGSGQDAHGPLLEPMVPEGKPWWQSRTIIGASVVLISTVASMWGWSVDIGVTTEVVMQVAALVGAVLAIYGRVRAERPIRRVRRARAVRSAGESGSASLSAIIALSLLTACAAVALLLLALESL